MALLAIFCGIILPILLIYYCIKDLVSYFRKEESEENIKQMEERFKSKYGTSKQFEDFRKKHPFN